MKLFLLVLVFFASTAAFAAQESPEDLLGFSMHVPKKTQDIMGLKIAAVTASSEGEKIIVTGRIPQDIENVIEVFVPESGVLNNCTTSLGAVVTKDQLLCTGIKAPVNGVIIAEYATTGETVDTVSPIYSIADLSTIPATFDVYEKDMSKIKTGQPANIYSTAYPDRIFNGQVTFVSPRIDESSFTVKVRIEIENIDLSLKPGMFVRAEIMVTDNQALLIVPTESVQNLDGINIVFLQDEPESFIPTKVNVQSASNKQSIIQADIKTGDMVVTDGAYSLKSKILENEISGGCAH